MNAHSKRKHVLIVEDEKDLALLMARILRENKIGTVVKTTAKEAIRHLKRSDAAIDAVILDLRLPDRSGFEVLKRCRVLQKDREGTKIIVVTAFGTPEVKEEAQRLGADAFFDKPIQIRTLLDFVANNNQKEENVSLHSKDKE